MESPPPPGSCRSLFGRHNDHETKTCYTFTTATAICSAQMRVLRRTEDRHVLHRSEHEWIMYKFSFHEWISEWMEGMNKLMQARMNGWMNFMKERKIEWMKEWREKRRKEGRNEWINERPPAQGNAARALPPPPFGQRRRQRAPLERSLFGKGQGDKVASCRHHNLNPPTSLLSSPALSRETHAARYAHRLLELKSARLNLFPDLERQAFLIDKAAATKCDWRLKLTIRIWCHYFPHWCCLERPTPQDKYK